MCWAVLGRRVNPTSVAVVRLVFAVGALAAIHAVVFGTLWPVNIPSRAFWVLCLSGVAGAALGDLCYFHSLNLIGPRLTMTIASLAPVIAALLVLLPPLRERMTWPQVAGMLVAVGGVAWVVSERRGREAWPTTPRSFRRGVALGLLSALFQAVGFVGSRLGMNAFSAAPVPPFSASLVRVAAACVGCWFVVACSGRARATLTPFRSRSNLVWLLLGVAAGPVVGIWLSMVALQGAATGVASTLISMSPLALIPFTWAAYGERPTWGRVLATAVALSGIALMMIH